MNNLDWLQEALGDFEDDYVRFYSSCELSCASADPHLHSSSLIAPAKSSSTLTSPSSRVSPACSRPT